MRKLLPPKIEFEYEGSDANEEIVQRMYNRIFDMAKQNILNKRKLNRKEIINKIADHEEYITAHY